MNRTGLMACRLFFGIMLFAFIFPDNVKGGSVDIVSEDKDWTVFKPNPTPPPALVNIGKAQNVCLDTILHRPQNCPAGAASYHYPHDAWTASTNIPDAHWIWAPGIKDTDSPAGGAKFTFKRQFWLCGAPQDGHIWIAGDNSTKIFVNPPPLSPVAVLSSTSNFSPPNDIVVPSASLRQGSNTIVIEGENDPDPTNCPSDQYQCNPAGVLFKGTFSDTVDPWPTCTGELDGLPYEVMQYENDSCPAGYSGVRSHQCLCNGNSAFFTPWADNCQPPPPRRACVDFEAPIVVGKHYGKRARPRQRPGSLAISSNGIKVFVENYKSSSGPTAFVDAYVDPILVPNGSNQSLRLNNISMRFDFSGLSFRPSAVAFLFLEKGGEQNIATDNNPPFVGHMQLLPTTIGGSSVAVVSSPLSAENARFGSVTIRGGIQKLLVGGQELWIDEVCAIE